MSLVLALAVLLATGCDSTSSSGTQSTPQLQGMWSGTLTDTEQHLEFAEINLRLTQDSNNQVSGLMRVFDGAWGDKVACFQLTGTAQPQAAFHLDGQDVVNKGDDYFVQLDGSSAAAGYELSGVYGAGHMTLAKLSGIMARATEEEVSFSCPSSDSATPTP